MGNIISFKDDSICISNGATDVFINLIALSGSELAKTDSEKRLIIWIIQIVGLTKSRAAQNMTSKTV